MNRALGHDGFMQSPQSFSRLAFYFFLRHSLSKPNCFSAALWLVSNSLFPETQRSLGFLPTELIIRALLPYLGLVSKMEAELHNLS